VSEIQPPDAARSPLSSKIADQIAAEVLRGRLPSGHSLGSEAQLMERHEVSRATLREAVRQLEAHGAVSMRRSHPRGLVVGADPIQATAQVLATYLAFVGATRREAYEVRGVLLLAAVRSAAARNTAAAAQALRDLASASAPPTDLAGALWRLERLVAEASANPALAMFLDVLTPAGEAAGPAPTVDHDDAAALWRTAQELAEAIVGRDEISAAQALRGLRGALAAGAEVECDPTTPALASSAYLHVPGAAKLNLGLATRVAEQIMRDGVGEGARLGSERDLTTRHGVGRGVLREALRILQAHGFVETRPGPGGGAIVGKPSPSYTIRKAVGYLDQLDLGAEHLLEVHLPLATASAELAARNGAAGQRATLEEMVEFQRRSSGPLQWEAAALVHLQIADMTANRVMALFARALLASVMRWPLPAISGPVAKAMADSHRALAAAVVAGDAALARRRMIDHCRQAMTWRPAAA